MLRFRSLSVTLLVSVTTLLFALLCVIVATGLLYLLRPVLSGIDDGMVRDALPLDELPGHADVSILLFLSVWGFVAVCASSCSPQRTRIGQSTLFAGAIWFWEVVGTTVSLAIVRQEGLIPSTGATLTTAAVYLAPLPVFGGAILARVVANHQQAALPGRLSESRAAGAIPRGDGRR
jgi:hypothetical protein